MVLHYNSQRTHNLQSLFILPLYRFPHFIKQQIITVFCQSNCNYRAIICDSTGLSHAFLRKEGKRNIKRDTRIVGAAIYINLMSLDRLESLNIGLTARGYLRTKR